MIISDVEEKIEMENNETVSVIIPVNNVQSYLGESLNSIIHQTYTNLEIILIDDGSTDGSGELCDNCAEKDQRVRVIHQKNKGVGAARNAGLDRMTGDIVAFLDPDDAYDVYYIEKLLSTMIREQADMAVCKFTIHNTKHRMIRRDYDKVFPEIKAGTYDRVSILQTLLDGKINGTVWNKIYRRALWKDIRFPERKKGEDLETIYRIMDVTRNVVVIDEPLYYYRKRPGSLTTSLSLEYLKDEISVLSWISSFIRYRIDVFSEEQFLRFDRKYLNNLIIAYIRLEKLKQDEEKRAVADELRQKAIKIGEKIGIENIPLRSKFAYHMICFCPWLLRITYPVYLSVNIFVNKHFR